MDVYIWICIPTYICIYWVTCSPFHVQARQHACGLRMRQLADGTAVARGDAAREAVPPVTPDAVQSSLEDNLRFAQNLQVTYICIYIHIYVT